jgi:excisionase family DNA binding protein
MPDIAPILDNVPVLDAHTEVRFAMTELLNVRETAKQLGVHENTVRNLEKRGLLQAARLPGSGFRRFRKEDVDRMREEMWSNFAPDTTLPAERRKPTKRHILTPEEHGE